ncbi:DUF3951 domain-containing protein [Neobacillus sp.]|uniref:DUF3951 domain-containing protein n=1 Tax=Neobacillus sp. TaxID=2675273 RepID=UPI00289A5651|nr:DUF3951 domain-containing protein [Neobacillus sp.]
MDLLNMAAVGIPMVIFVITLIGFYKLFIKKKNITPFYTPFDEITGQTPIVFHQEHEVIAEDEDQGDGKKNFPTD